MPAKATGNGATAAFTSSTFTADIKKISAITSTGEAIEVSHLGTTVHKEYIPGDLVEISEVTIEYFYDPMTAPLAVNTKDTLTITLPEVTTTGNPGSITGTGFVTENTQTPDLENGAAMMGSLKFRYDGLGTPLAFTAETNA
jgi:hypothetical protein